MYSHSAESLPAMDLRRIVMEGIIFRITGIIQDLVGENGPSQIILSGGLSEEVFLRKGIAVCTGRPVQWVKDREMTLLGTARLASGLTPMKIALEPVMPAPGEGAYLKKKYRHWAAWVIDRIG